MYETQLNVRFGETDALGHINNTSYFVYLEEARLRFFESIGASMDVKKWDFILASTKCDFLSQGFFNQQLTIKTFVKKIGTKSCEIGHDIVCSETGRLIVKGEAIIVFYDFDKQKSEPIPMHIKERLQEEFVQLS